MTQTEALKLALEALESTGENDGYHGVTQYFDETMVDQAITAIKAALLSRSDGEAQTRSVVKDELMGWKLVPIEPTNEMLKAMDECSTEGYDERLPAGIASSVYMAAVEVAPKPPQQKINNEPKCVAIVEVFGKDWRLDYMALPVGKHKLYAQQYLYTTLPPQRTWVGLTDEEWEAMYYKFAKHQEYGAFVSGWDKFARAIEAKLKEKNT